MSASTFSNSLLKQDDRKRQLEEMSAARDLLLFNQAALLKGADGPAIVKQWQKHCKEMFGIGEDENIIANFSKTFRESKRFPGGLFTYAARVQTLPADQKNSLIKLLGEYATAVLKGSFPAIRYDFSRNEHLMKIFSKNEPLLKLWKANTSIPATALISNISSAQPSPQKPQDLVKNLLKQSLGDGHLEKNRFPTLYSVNWNDSTSINDTLSQLKGQYNEIKNKIDKEKTNKRELDFLRKQKDRIIIETSCLELCLLEDTKMIESVKALIKKFSEDFPEEITFKQDLEGMQSQLTPREAHRAKWVVEDTDQWEDMLLMGTEVNNSCQRINGDAKL